MQLKKNHQNMQQEAANKQLNNNHNNIKQVKLGNKRVKKRMMINHPLFIN